MIEFNWQNIPDAYRYRIQVDDDNIFSFPYVDVETEDPTYSVGISEGTRYWKVSCYDKAGNWCPWSDAWSFTIDTTPPGTPSLISPTSGSVFVDTTPTLEWTTTVDATSYQIQYSYNSGFTNLYLQTSTTFTTYNTPATADGLYYWRVRARDEAQNYGPYSTVWSFTIDTTPPAGPTLNSPEDGLISNNNEQTFSWEANGGSNYYRFQLDQTGTFTSPIVDNYLFETSYTRSSLTDGTYYWRVKARDPVGNWGGWSDVRSLTIDTVAPLITDVIYLPEIVDDFDVVSIYCNVSDTNGLSSVQVYYRVNGNDWLIVTMNWTNDDQYEAVIGTFDLNDLIEFYIVAKDNTIPPYSTTDDNGGMYYSFTVGASDITGPSIDDVAINPNPPKDDETVTISCSVIDESGISSVTLYYRVNGGDWITVSMVYTSGDNYEVIIGAFDYADFVEFYIEAIDDYPTHNIAIEDNSGLYYNFTVTHSDVYGPTIVSILHQPSIPNDAQSVIMSCSVMDPNGILFVTLVYRVNGGIWLYENMTLSTGATYFTVIGSFNYNDIVEYYIFAFDNSPNHNSATNDNGGSYYNFIVSHSDLTGPTIEDVEHLPASPTEVDTITISCSVTDTNDLLYVSLIYSVNGGSWIEVNMTLTTGSTYVYTIGTFSYNDQIDYYIVAVDNSPNYNTAINDNNGSLFSFTIVSSDVSGPTISAVSQTPNPASDIETITISCDVYDANGIQSVTLYCRINGGSWSAIGMVCTSGDTYEITIGAFAYDDEIEYYFVAIDNSPNHNETTNDNGGLYYSSIISSSDIVSPTIENITHQPDAPTDLEIISINCTVTDAYGIQSVTLNYRINNGTWITLTMTLISGNTYGATIGTFAAGDIIQYYIVAVDDSPNQNMETNNNDGLYFSFEVQSISTGITSLLFALPLIAVLALSLLKRRKL